QSTWTATGSTNGMPKSYPTSDAGAYDLYRFGTGQPYKDKSDVAFDNGVNIGAAFAFLELGALTWKNLPTLS
ncbi:MAG TPA: hypothetical protein VFQ65_30135, partial [Kofleriaceae bacterium]|nr:hypothetical protein [Kofleriaceae bacterium]